MSVGAVSGSSYSSYDSTVKSSEKKENEAVAEKKTEKAAVYEKSGSTDTVKKSNAALVAKMKADIADDGYWGVSQTSDRIFDFAMALSGGDEEKMEKMKAAVEKGFKLATGSWGKDLPDISNQTYDAVMKKFDDFFGKTSEVEA